MNFFKRIFHSKKKRIHHRKQRSKLKEQALEKIVEIGTRQFGEESLADFAAVFRIYLAKKLGVSKQLTHKELISHLKDKKIQALIVDEIERLSEDIERYEFAGEAFSKEDLLDMIRRFKDVLEVF